MASVGALVVKATQPASRPADVAAFFHTYRGYGAQFISSPYAFQEVAKVITDAHKKAVLTKHRNAVPKARYEHWHDFSTKRPAEAAVEHRKIMRVVYMAWKRIQGHGIWFTVPRKGEGTDYGRRVERIVVAAAPRLKTDYPGLDWADAHHIATGIVCGAEWFATTDEGWKDVAGINVFCDQ